MIERALIGLAVSGIIAGASFFYGQSLGVQAERQRQEQDRIALQSKLFDAGERISRLASELAAERDAREKLVQEIEDEARQDPASVDRVPSDDSLRRLQRRWGQP